MSNLVGCEGFEEENRKKLFCVLRNLDKMLKLSRLLIWFSLETGSCPSLGNCAAYLEFRTSGLSEVSHMFLRTEENSLTLDSPFCSRSILCIFLLYLNTSNGNGPNL